MMFQMFPVFHSVPKNSNIPPVTSTCMLPIYFPTPTHPSFYYPICSSSVYPFSLSYKTKIKVTTKIPSIICVCFVLFCLVVLFVFQPLLQFSERVSFFRNLQPLNRFLSFLDKILKKGILSQSKAKITVFVCFNGKFTS